MVKYGDGSILLRGCLSLAETVALFRIEGLMGISKCQFTYCKSQSSFRHLKMKKNFQCGKKISPRLQIRSKTNEMT